MLLYLSKNYLLETLSKISIVTINYNSLRALRKTIDSLKLQDRELFEFIIVDGKSDDIDEFEINAFSNFADKFIYESDQGIADAWNKGINLCNNKWVLLLNSGDILEKNILKKLILFLLMRI